MLILIPTPIGNLADVSKRAVSALASCDVVLCEDTRHAIKLFTLLNILIPKVLSLHQWNETARQAHVLSLLQNGSTVGLVSDAGTPGICDPGATIITQCHAHNIPVTIIPGPCAFACAYALCGATQEHMQFIGFLPKKKQQIQTILRNISHYQGTTVCYESPHRIHKTIEYICDIEPEWELVLVRELTKLHEQVVRKKARDIMKYITENKGEYTLVLLPCPRVCTITQTQVCTHVQKIREKFQCSLKQAVELVAKQFHIPQKTVYEHCIKD